MKSKNTDTILLDDVLDIAHPLIGHSHVIIRGGHGQVRKGTLVPSKYLSNTYFSRSAEGWERGNGYADTPQTVSEWVDHFEGFHDFKMYVFDTPQELFKWLSE